MVDADVYSLFVLGAGRGQLTASARLRASRESSIAHKVAYNTHPLMPSGNFIYHQLLHSKILHSADTTCFCVSYESHASE